MHQTTQQVMTKNMQIFRGLIWGVGAGRSTNPDVLEFAHHRPWCEEIIQGSSKVIMDQKTSVACKPEHKRPVN